MSITSAYPCIDSIPKEILIKGVCPELEPTDYKNFLLSYKRINTEINEYKKNYSCRFHDLQIKVLVNSAKTKSMEEIYDKIKRCCNDGNTLQLEALLHCRRFNKPEDKQKLFSFLLNASKKDHQNIIRVFVKSGRFNEMLVDRFRNSTQNLQIEPNIGIAVDIADTIMVAINSKRVTKRFTIRARHI